MKANLQMAHHIAKAKGTLFGKPKSEVIRHPGAETASARAAGKSVHSFAESHKHSSGKAGKRARLALVFEKWAARRKKG